MILQPDNPQRLIDVCIEMAPKFGLQYGWNLLYNNNGEIQLNIVNEKVLYGPFYYKGYKIYAASSKRRS